MSISHTKLQLNEPFDLAATLASGSAFCWGRYNRRGWLLAYGEPDRDGWFTGPTFGRVLRLRQSGPMNLEIQCSADNITAPSWVRPKSPEEFAIWYFRLEEKLSKIAAAIGRDPHAADAVRILAGLRLIRVEPLECLLTFLSSPQNRIPKIAAILNAVSRMYGDRLTTAWGSFYLPPNPDRLARARPAKLAACGLRYGVPQAKNIIRTCRRLAADPKFFQSNSAPEASYETAWQNVIDTCIGAGPKVADCVCLFALGHLRAVPVDVHVFNSTLRLYRNRLKGLRAKDANFLNLREYRRIGDFYRSVFGDRAGYAQQYLFTAERIRRGFFNPNKSPSSSPSPTRSHG